MGNCFTHLILGCAQCWGTYLGACGAVVTPAAPRADVLAFGSDSADVLAFGSDTSL